MGRGVLAGMVVGLVMLGGCETGSGSATVHIKNDFDNPAVEGFKPPSPICHATYLGVEFGRIGIGETSAPQVVEPGLDHVLMVVAWDDPDCHPENCLPIASKAEEEVVDGQVRTIAIGKPSHQGPCPPEGVPPIPQAVYDRILDLYPEYGFKPYDQRTQNPQCL